MNWLFPSLSDFCDVAHHSFEEWWAEVLSLFTFRDWDVDYTGWVVVFVINLRSLRGALRFLLEFS